MNGSERITRLGVLPLAYTMMGVTRMVLLRAVSQSIKRDGGSEEATSRDRLAETDRGV